MKRRMEFDSEVKRRDPSLLLMTTSRGSWIRVKDGLMGLWAEDGG